MATNDKISVHVVHDNRFMAAGIAAALGCHSDIDVEYFDDFEDAIAQPSYATRHALRDRPRVILADYVNGMELLKRREHRESYDRATTDVAVLIITWRDREWDVRAAIFAGANGYVLESCAFEELAAGVRALCRGARYLCSEVAGSIAASMTRDELTSRESQVLELLTRGFPNKTIAKDLGIAVGTVKAHVLRVFEKLGARTRTEAVAIATERGIRRDVLVEARC